MCSRRQFLASFTGGTVIGAAIGVSAESTGYGSIIRSNFTENDVWMDTVVRSSGGLFSESTVEYENVHRIRPTDTYAVTEPNAVEAGDYKVTVALESADRSEETGPFTTNWVRGGCHHQELKIEIKSGLTVEFLQHEC